MFFGLSFLLFIYLKIDGHLTRRFSQRLLFTAIPLARFKSSLRRG